MNKERRCTLLLEKLFSLKEIAHFFLQEKNPLDDRLFKTLSNPEDEIDALALCVGRKLAFRRYSLDISQKSLAHITGLSVSYISSLERGEKAGGIIMSQLCLVAFALDYELSDLFTITTQDIKRSLSYRESRRTRHASRIYTTERVEAD